jgi:hypothetical protein
MTGRPDCRYYPIDRDDDKPETREKIMTRHYRTNLLIASVFAAGFAVATAPLARADADPGKEMSTAATHAGLAAKATDIKMTQMHLQHVVNCLVGPKGKGFDATPGNPCKDQGNGAIPDSTDKGQKKVMQQALNKARAGLKTKDEKTAQKDATAAQTLLTPKTM